MKLFRITPGAVIGTDELPNLPPSVVATLNRLGHRVATPRQFFRMSMKWITPRGRCNLRQQLIGIDVVGN